MSAQNTKILDKMQTKYLDFATACMNQGQTIEGTKWHLTGMQKLLHRIFINSPLVEGKFVELATACVNQGKDIDKTQEYGGNNGQYF